MTEQRRVLVVDVGGNNVKCWLSSTDERRKTPSGPKLTGAAMVEAVLALTRDWTYDVVSLGVPGPVADNRLLLDPVNLGPGWAGLDFAELFGRPTRVVNDAVLQALGSYEGGRMLFLGLGTGLGNTLVVEGIPIGMELGHLPYRRNRTFEDHVGQRGLDRFGKKAWRKFVSDVVRRLKARDGGGLRRPRRRQRQAARRAARGLPPRRQQERLPGRPQALGRDGPDPRPRPRAPARRGRDGTGATASGRPGRGTARGRSAAPAG